MAFAFTIDPVTPGNNDLVSLGAGEIRDFKSAVIERLASVFTNINADPMVLKTGIATTGAMTVGNTLTVTTGGLTVSAGTTAVQALTATTGTFSSSVLAGAGSVIGFTGRSIITSPSDGAVNITNNAGAVAASLTIGALVATTGTFSSAIQGTSIAGTAGTVDQTQAADGSVIIARATHATYTSSSFASVITRAASTAFGHFIGTSNGVTVVLLRGDGSALFAQNVTVTAGGLTVSAGTSALQAVTATTLTTTGVISAGGYLQLTAAASADSGGSNLRIGNGTQSTVGANGSATAPPAQPIGYIQIFVGVTPGIIPYYNA